MIFAVVKGFLLGLLVSIFNHYIVIRVANRMTSENIHSFKGKVVFRYLIRYATNLLALFLVYKNMPMLIATAIGLTSVKNYLYIKYILKKEGGE
ncbi:ATP synthase I chain [Desulfonispora thiosulfatigenes DSM 11270]|uniref:ATP synthase I chain n=1 Tax=Desulfonispora thiosulfatigenes DSM 11270 TaxID=656914 RepID=A0A1W1V5F5_DESTI|nr:ATP synthase subunit I [Desulfonispora thiosulfatigenes]SMB88204.1 ATP synthase I chain [Desulfonispora thiosulfatigenes DSM 11270]